MSNTDDYYHYNYTALHKSEIFAIVIGVISTILPLSVVFILLYKYDILVKGKTLTHYILMIAISDTISAITISFGYPKNNTPACYAQGFLSLFFGRSSIFFTEIIIIQLLFVIVYRRFFLDIYITHIIVWPLNIILQILPYTTGAYYGRTFDDDKGVPIIRCLVAHSSNVNNALFWNNYVLNFWILASFGVIGICTIGILCYSSYVIHVQPSNIVLRNYISDICSTVIWYHHHHHHHLTIYINVIIIIIIIYRYPFAMLVAYVPSTCKYIIIISLLLLLLLLLPLSYAKVMPFTKIIILNILVIVPLMV